MTRLRSQASMVSACILHFDKFEIAEQKASVPDWFIYLFQESDRRNFIDEDGDEGVGYFAERSVVLNRLDLAGATTIKTEREFHEWLDETRERYAAYDWAQDIYRMFLELNYEEWKCRAKDVLESRYDFARPSGVYRDELDRIMRDMHEEELFFSSNYLISLRALLEAMPQVKEVWLDISPLIHGGWIGHDDPICEERRRPESFPQSVLEPCVILTEGSTDVLILRRSLERLYPHLADYISFFDYETSNSDAGASWVVKFLKAFTAARINTLIIAIFDNDSAGNEAFNATQLLKFPPNIKTILLPYIELGREYPTIGPQGIHVVDINGSAVGIELFTGRHNLVGTDGNLNPIVWGNYMRNVHRYQGSLQDKSAPLARFMKETEQHDNLTNYGSIYPELQLLWEKIFKVIQEARSVG